jgi:hypothetical protein
VGLSTPEQPFLINVGIYGGSGHLSLYANPQGILGFEASFQFGAVTQFAVGPLVGNGYVTSGVFLRTFKNDRGDTLSTVDGLVTAGGNASISIFRFAALLQLRVSQQPGGSLVGTAIFTYSFSAGIREIRFRVTMRDSAALDAPGPIMLAANVPDAELAGLLPGAQRPEPATITSRTRCKGQDFHAYQSYFADAAPYQPEVW